MNVKKVLLFLLIIIVGQAIFTFWTIGDADVAPDGANVEVVAKFLVITFAVKISGDLFGKFIFKFPGYNWGYVRDYIKDELFATIGLYFAFTIVWYAVAFFIAPLGDQSILASIFKGGLLPASYYMIIGTSNFEEKEVSEKRMKKKI